MTGDISKAYTLLYNGIVSKLPGRKKVEHDPAVRRSLDFFRQFLDITVQRTSDRPMMRKLQPLRGSCIHCKESGHKDGDK